MSQEFLDAVEAADASEDDHLVVDGAHFPSTVAGLCSCMILVLQALKVSAGNSGDAAMVHNIQRMQVMLRDQAARTFPKMPWGKV